MLINYDLQKLHEVLMDFYHATGLPISFRDENFVHFTTDEMEARCCDFCKVIRGNATTIKYCNASDRQMIELSKQKKEMVIRTCHAGLIDVIVPLFHNDIFLGNLTFGQMRKDTDFSSVYKHICEYPLDLKDMEQKFNRLPVFDEKKIKSIANIAAILATHILLENILKPTLDANIEHIITYVDLNLDKELSLEQITQDLHISKSSLYRIFHAHFHCTIIAYIMQRRISKSMEMLLNSNLSIEQIAQNLGFTGAATYVRVFKKINGVTPSQFRKQQQTT